MRVQSSVPEVPAPAAEASGKKDDAWTLAALGILAFVGANVTHEALGHGLATIISGAKPVVLTTCYFTSSGSIARWIPAAGGLANLVEGLLSLVVLNRLQPAAPATRYFVTLLLAFNLLFAAAYPAYSGIAAFGDWAAVIAGLSPAWLWRLLLVLGSIALYLFSLRLLAGQMGPFGGSDTPQALNRLRRMTLLPFLAALVIAALAGALNPNGWMTMLTAGIPAAAASFGLTQIDHYPIVRTGHPAIPPAGPIPRSLTWIITAAVVALLFVCILGPGIRFRPGTS